MWKRGGGWVNARADEGDMNEKIDSGKERRYR